ncbi:MAG TPA: acyloxyacyl hydrolase, partial [Thermoanaerobaculia bacterium]|nr:acyloxyacyl hydrolase [Thermoanaerobaculia bacterium]
YVELLVGPMWAEKQVPASTSRFNFITQPGFGLTFARRGRVAPTLGYRFSHVSNGGYSPRNPGINVNSIVLGLRFQSSRSDGSPEDR